MSAKTIPLFPILVASLAAQTVSVVDADPNTGVKFTTTATAVALPMYLELDQGKVTGLRVEVDNFVAPDGSLVPVNVAVMLNGAAASAPLNVAQQDRPQVRVSATLPISGDYKSHVSLIYSDKRQKSIPLTVTRQRNALPIQIEGLNTVAVTRWFSASGATANFVIRETGGQPVTLYTPTLVGLAVKDGDKKRQAAYDNESFEVGKDKGDIHIGGQASIPAKLIVNGIRDTGEYSGKIRVSSSDTAPVDADLSILIKDNAVVAFFFIFVGVGMSYLIRRYTKESRPKLVALRSLADIREALDKVQSNAGELGDVQKKVFDGLRDQIAELDRGLTRGDTSDTGAAGLKDLQNKITFLPSWLTVGRKLASVNPPSLAATPRGKWDAMADSYFLKKTAGDAPAADLQAVAADIDKAVKDDLLARIAAFQKTAEDHKASQPASAAALDAGVLSLLVKAKEEATNDKLPEATADFQSARRAYARVLTDQLAAELNGQAPPGFKPAEWDALRQQLTAALDKVRQETDPEAALSGFEAANRDYIAAVMRAMRTAIGESAAALVAGNVSPQDQKPLQTKLDDAAKALDTGEAALKGGQTDTARNSYQLAADALREVSAGIKQGGGGQMGFSVFRVLPSLVTIPEGAGMRETSSIPASQLREMSLSDKLTIAIDGLDLWLNLAILLIAIVVGLNILWASDPVWGGWKAYITALLWGLGLQQAGGATLDGLSAVTKKITE